MFSSSNCESWANFDQMFRKENDDPEDGQGLGAFFRYGYANSERNDVAGFWSLGLQCQGLLDGRDDDVLGLGYAQGIFSNNASSTFTEDNEDVLEVYYNAQVTPWLNLSPMVQYVADPGGTDTAKDATVCSACVPNGRSKSIEKSVYALPRVGQSLKRVVKKRI